MFASPAIAEPLELVRVELARAPHDLETRLVAEVRASAPLRRALSRVAGRMIEKRGWERIGHARVDDYAAERLGISGRELRDLAAVDRALRGLPALDAAFRGGEIGWTQLRLVCRVATPGDQSDWLALARQSTARALSREVREVDGCAHEAASRGFAPDGDVDARVGVVLRCTPAVRARWWRARQLANRVAGRTLSGEAFAEALAAEVCSALPPSEESLLSQRVPRQVDGREVVNSRSAEAPAPALVSPFVADLERDLDTADVFELDARLCRALRLEARRLARVAELLEQVVARRLHRRLGYRGLDRYAEERLDMSPSRARALLRVARAAQTCLPLREAFASGRISWVQAHALVAVLVEPEASEHRAAWVAHAERVSVRRLCDDVERALAAGEYAPGRANPETETLQTGAIARSRGETARIFFAAVPEVAQLFRAALATVQRRLDRIRGRPSSPNEALDAMLEHGLEWWGAYQALSKVDREHRVYARDGWRCTVPGCSSYRSLHAHHIVFRSQGGSDDLGNLTTLCAWHHQRGIHQGRVRCRGQAPDALHFELGRRPGRTPLLAYGPGEVRMS